MDPGNGAGPADLVAAAMPAGPATTAGPRTIAGPGRPGAFAALTELPAPAAPAAAPAAPAARGASGPPGTLAASGEPAARGASGPPGTLAASGEPAAPGAEPGVSVAKCRVREILGRIGDKWSLFIIFRLGDGPQRFTSLKRAVDGISQRMLTVTLRGLERDGIVSRTMYPVMPPRVDYALTPLGHTLLDAVGALMAWADEHLAEVDAARDAYDARSSSGVPEMPAPAASGHREPAPAASDIPEMPAPAASDHREPVQPRFSAP